MQKNITLDVSIEYDPSYSYAPPSISVTTENEVDFSTINLDGKQATSRLTSEGTYCAILWDKPTRANASSFPSCRKKPELTGKTSL